MVGRVLGSLPNATTVVAGDKFLVQQGVVSKQVDKDILFTAQNTTKNGGGSVQDFIDDTELTLSQTETWKNVKTMAEWIENIVSNGALPKTALTGDSTMRGAKVGDLGVQDPNNPPATLQWVLDLFYTGLTVTNFAISGSTLRGMIAGTDGSGSTFESKLQSGGAYETYSIIICNHGINDNGNSLSINQYKQDCETFVILCRKYGKTPIFATPNPNPSIGLINQAASIKLGSYAQCMRDTASQMQVDLVDQFAYFTATSKKIPITSIVPDGAHLSSRAYLQAGMNLAIPFINCRTIGDEESLAGLNNVTYKSNAGVEPTGVVSRCGNTLQIEVSASVKGISYPVIFDSPVSNFSVIGLKYINGTTCDLILNKSYYGFPLFFKKTYGSVSDDTKWNWDSEINVNSQCWAGMNIISLLTNEFSEVGKNIFFSGIYIPPKSISDFIRFGSWPNYTYKPFQLNHIGDFGVVDISYDAGTSTGRGIDFVDKYGWPVMKIRKGNGTIPVMETYKDGVVVNSSEFTGLPTTDAKYRVQVELSPIRFGVWLTDEDGAVVGNVINYDSTPPEVYVTGVYNQYNINNTLSFSGT